MRLTVVAIATLYYCIFESYFRLQGDDLFGTSVVHVNQPVVAQLAFQKVAVPFSLELFKPGDASFCGRSWGFCLFFFFLSTVPVPY